MNWLESIIYGLVSGITAFLPISTSAHQLILMKLFGENASDPLLDFFIHIALLFSVFTAGRNLIDQLRRQNPRQNNRYYGSRVHTGSLELRFLKNTIFPFMFIFLVLSYTIRIQNELSIIAIFLLINGVLLFLQSRMIQGNKDERSMSVLDSTLTGAAAALCVFPGISYFGAMLTVFTARGVDKQKAVNWAILLSIPILIVASFKDILNIISGTGTIYFLENIVGYLLAIICVYFAGYFSVMLMKYLVTGKDYQGFAYYCWGASLFAFILHLTIV